MMNSKRLLTICGFAIGAAAISAAPAGAVAITGGSLNFNLTTGDFYQNVNTANPFNVSFNPSGFASVAFASGGFNTAPTNFFPTVFPAPGSTYAIAPSTGTFQYTGAGTTYRLTNQLNFAFGNGVTIGIGPNSTFDFTPTTGTGVVGSEGFNVNILNAANPGTAIVNGTDSVPLQSLAFTFSDQLNVGGGTGGIGVSGTAVPVPEPFTIIGTLIGGTAALRMRKKLMTAVNK